MLSQEEQELVEQTEAAARAAAVTAAAEEATRSVLASPKRPTWEKKVGDRWVGYGRCATSHLEANTQRQKYKI